MQKAAAKDLKSNSKNAQGKINHLSKVYDRLMKEMKDMAYISRSSVPPKGRMYMWGDTDRSDFLMTLQISF